MTKRLLADSTRLYVDETTAPVLDPGRGKTKTGYLWAVLRDDRGWNGPAPPGVVFHYRPGRKGEYAAKILKGFNGTIQVDAYGAYTHLATPKRPGGDPSRLALAIVLEPMAHNGSLLGARPTQADQGQAEEGITYCRRGAAAHRRPLQDRGCHPRV